MDHTRGREKFCLHRAESVTPGTMMEWIHTSSNREVQKLRGPLWKEVERPRLAGYHEWGLWSERDNTRLFQLLYEKGAWLVVVNVYEIKHEEYYSTSFSPPPPLHQTPCTRSILSWFIHNLYYYYHYYLLWDLMWCCERKIVDWILAGNLYRRDMVDSNVSHKPLKLASIANGM